MSECVYFWGSFLRSIEIDPICPPAGAVAVWVSTFPLASDTTGPYEEHLVAFETAPNGDPGANLLATSPAAMASPQTTGQWVDMDTLIPGVGFRIGGPTQQGGGIL